MPNNSQPSISFREIHRHLSGAQLLSLPLSGSQEGKTKLRSVGISLKRKVCASSPLKNGARADCVIWPHPRGSRSRCRPRFVSQSTRHPEGARRFLAKETPLLLGASPLPGSSVQIRWGGRLGGVLGLFPWGCKRMERGKGLEATPFSACDEDQSSPGVARFLIAGATPYPHRRPSSCSQYGPKARNSPRSPPLSSNLHPRLCRLPAPASTPAAGEA